VRARRGHARRRAQSTPRIRYPADDTVIALDPDVPMSHQRVAFVASPAIGGLRWRVDDAARSSATARACCGRPARGRHRITLEDAPERRCRPSTSSFA
jgi:penicillin-binding protein 1C